MADPSASPPRHRHNDYQRRYFARPERTRARMAPEPTPYARRHLEATLGALGLAPGSRVLELGCGMGRFSRLLAEAGHRVTAVDLSPELVEELRRVAAGASWGERVDALCADAGDLGRALEAAHGGARPEPFDAVVGFFFLHHLPALAPTLEAALAHLRPGGGVAFCEPHAWYLPFYAQILLTPGMTWAGDRGVARMRRGVVLPALAAAGFHRLGMETYGLFPPALANRAAGRRVEALLERWLPGPRAFAVFHGTKPEAGGDALLWRCPGCGAELRDRPRDAGGGLTCAACTRRVDGRSAHLRFAPGFRPDGFAPERRDHLEALAADHFWFPPRQSLLAKLLDRHAALGSGPGGAAVEIGCGAGRFLPALARRCRRVVGLDAYDSSLDRAAATVGEDPRICLAQADVRDLPCPTAAFDLAVALDVLEHLDDDAAALAELARVIRPGGRLLLTVPALPALWSDLDEAAGHRRRYRRRDLEDKLTTSGWRPIHHTYYQALLLPLVWLSRRLRHRATGGDGRRSPPTTGLDAFERRPPAALGRLLGAVNAFEVAALSRLRLPFGSSLVIVAEREAAR